MQTSFIQIYVRALGLLATERVSVTLLAIANAAVATLFFIEPVLFGRLIDVL